MLTKKQILQKYSKRIGQKINLSHKGCETPAFIFGEQRSGTNFLINILVKSIETECYHENDPEAFDNYVLRDLDIITHLIHKSRAKAVIFKSICDNQNANHLLRVFPTAKGIWIYRQYQDVVNSALRNWKRHNNYLYYMLFEPEIARWRVENVTSDNLKLVKEFYNKGLSDASARALIWYLRNFQYFQQNLNENEKVLLIQYENIVKNPELFFKNIFDFLGLKFRSTFYTATYATSVNKNTFPEIDPEIQYLCDNLFAKLKSIRKHSL